KQSAAGEKTMSASAGQTRESETAAATAGDFEKSDPLQPGHGNGASNAAPESRTAPPPMSAQAAASGSGGFEKSNPIPGGSSVVATAPPAR
ncbi:MAG: hypothetical protein C0504_04285, partial [Candidatus Solibacter sp.]|nr:hypothetical protein [Candidatus Solibacter sp.]